jgi:hypothetical protein
MAVQVQTNSVGTSAIAVAQNTYSDTGSAISSDVTAREYCVKNVTATGSVYLGPPGVTTGNGFKWDPADGPFAFVLEPGESMYAITPASPGAQTVQTISAGRS